MLFEAKIYAVLQKGLGIPKLYWYGTEGDYNIIVMELLGPNIEELMEFCRGSLSPACTIVLAQQFLSLIEYFHQKGFIHRDIKPENFMMGREGSAHTAYIIDYGVMRRVCDVKHKYC